jgi:hypothetical protein
MRRTLGTILLGICLGLAFPSKGGAQPSVLFGITAHYEADIPSSSYRDPVYASSCGCDGIGTMSGRSASYAATLGLADPFDAGFDLLGRLAVRSSTQSFTSSPYDSPLTGEPASTPATYIYGRDSRALSLRFELLGSRTVADWIVLSAGPWLTSRVRTNATRRESIDEPASATFPSGDRTRVIADGASETIGGIDMGAALGLSLRIPLDESVMLLPELFIHVALDPDAESGGDGRFIVGGGTSLILNLSSLWNAPPENDAPILPPLPEPTASLDIYATDESGDHVEDAYIAPRITYHRREMPLPARIYFDEGSDRLPDRYVSADRESLSPDSLAQLDLPRLYDRGLDLIGMRMSRTSDATVTVNGSSDREEPMDMGTRRAQAVASYLVEKWNIAPNRIRIASPSENDRTRTVTISSESVAITAPIVTERLHHGFDLPPIGLTPRIDAAAGTRSWDITVRWNGSVVGFYSSDPTVEQSSDIALDIPETSRPGSALPPLVAQLRVEDSTGAVATAVDTLQLSIPEASEPEHPDQELTFVEPFSPSVTNGRSSDEEIVETVAAAAQSHAHITIASLSRRRGNGMGAGAGTLERLARRLRTTVPHAEITVIPPSDSVGGEADEPVAHDARSLPEAALLDGILITVEQPRPR